MDLLLVGSDEEHLDTCTAVCMCVRMRISMQVVYYVVVASWVLVLGFAAAWDACRVGGWVHVVTQQHLACALGARRPHGLLVRPVAR